MTDFWIKQNDTFPALQVTLKDEDGASVNLSGTTVVFNMRDTATETLKINNQTATVVDALNGVVEYRWATGDTDTVDSYEAEFEVTYGSGGIETFPNTAYIEIEVVEEVG